MSNSYDPAIRKRLRLMRYASRQRGKAVPSLDRLQAIADALVDGECPICKRVMIWSGKVASAATIQHDASGAIRIICKSCNSKHAQLPGDTFYDLKPGELFCHRCNSVKAESEFFRDGRCRPRGRASWCKSCKTLATYEWRKKNPQRWSQLKEASRKRCLERKASNVQ